MKKLLTLQLVLIAIISKADYWTQMANFPGLGRELSSSFSIGNKGYFACGFISGSTYLNDLWEWNQITNTWTQKANFPGVSRYAAVGFAINNKGYIGTGASSGGPYNDFWEYDPITNSWTPKANFGGTSVYYAESFSIGNKGYIGGGQFSAGSYLSDFWEWDQLTNTWVQKNSLPITLNRSVGFPINGKGYFSTGEDVQNHFINQTWEYDPVIDVWTQKANFPAAARADAAAFSICDKGYLGTGGESPFYKDFWQFDPNSNQWIQKTNFPSQKRDDCIYFSIGNKGYIGLGQTFTSNYAVDFWEYTPDSACATGIEEFQTSNLDFTICPNPVKDILFINYDGKEKIILTITDVDGKKIFAIQLSQTQSSISLKDFSKGIYFVEMSNGKQKAVRKFLKE